MFKELRTSFILFSLFMLLTGLCYPLFILGIGQTLFPQRANGSLIEANGKIIGSSLIGQNFASPRYFHPRPSAAGNGYDASNSSGSNLAPSSSHLKKSIQNRVNDLKKDGSVGIVPIDLVTSSGSGLDPHISPAAARFQVARVAATRNIKVTKIEELIVQFTESPTFGILGDPRVNVLKLNQALDQIPSSKP